MRGAAAAARAGQRGEAKKSGLAGARGRVRALVVAYVVCTHALIWALLGRRGGGGGGVVVGTTGLPA